MAKSPASFSKFANLLPASQPIPRSVYQGGWEPIDKGTSTVPGKRARFHTQDVEMPGREGADRQTDRDRSGEHEDLWGLCCLGLSGVSRIVVGKTRIPFFEEGPERAVERAGSDLQQEMCATLRPLHLLTFGEALADDGVHR